MEKGWLKPILEQASADWETWPAWQRGQEVEEREDQRETGQTETCHEESQHDGKAAA